MDPSKEFLSSLFKAFLRPPSHLCFTQMVSFLKHWQYHQIETLLNAASRTISCCLLSLPIPLLLFKASLPLLQITLTHFALSSYEWALCLPTSFPISGLNRHRVKPRLCRSSWRAFASTHSLILPSTSPREPLLACPPSLP